MVPIWNDLKSYKCHLENMKVFRKTHIGLRLTEELKLNNISKEKPIIDRPPRIIKSLTDSRGKIVIVPMWEAKLPSGAEN